MIKNKVKKVFNIKTGAYDPESPIDKSALQEIVESAKKQLGILNPAYDPHQDEEKIMSGEVETYFD